MAELSHLRSSQRAVARVGAPVCQRPLWIGGLTTSVRPGAAVHIRPLCGSWMLNVLCSEVAGRRSACAWRTPPEGGDERTGRRENLWPSHPECPMAPVENLADRATSRPCPRTSLPGHVSGTRCRMRDSLRVVPAYNDRVGPKGLTAFSGRGGIPHRRYLQATAGARERPTQAFAGVGVSRSGAMPGPTVTVRMKEIA